MDLDELQEAVRALPTCPDLDNPRLDPVAIEQVKKRKDALEQLAAAVKPQLDEVATVHNELVLEVHRLEKRLYQEDLRTNANQG